MLCVILKFSPASVVLEQLQESRSAGGTTRPLGICLTICSNLSAPCAGSRSFQPQAGAGVCWRSGSSGGSSLRAGVVTELCAHCASPAWAVAVYPCAIPVPQYPAGSSDSICGHSLGSLGSLCPFCPPSLGSAGVRLVLLVLSTLGSLG